MSLRYKFVELSLVTDEGLETVVNEWVAKGWTLEAIRFAMSEASRRPAMAFVAFVRDEAAVAAPGAAGAVKAPARARARRAGRRPADP